MCVLDVCCLTFYGQSLFSLYSFLLFNNNVLLLHFLSFPHSFHNLLVPFFRFFSFPSFLLLPVYYFHSNTALPLLFAFVALYSLF